MGGWDKRLDAEWDLIRWDLSRKDKQHTGVPYNLTFPQICSMSSDELWYHMSAKAKLHHDLRRPVSEDVLKWASSEVERAEALFFLDPTAYRDIPLLRLVTAYGIQYGVHGQLETLYLATDKVTHDNLPHIAKRLCVVLSMREYIDRQWVELITEGVTQAGPRIRRGSFAVGCSFTTLGSYVAGVDSNKLTAELYSPDQEESRPFQDVHPFNFTVDISSSDSDEPGSPPFPPTLRRCGPERAPPCPSFYPSLVSSSEPY